MKASHKCNRGAFSLIDVFALVACLAFLALFMLPRLARRSCCTARVNCVNNLKQVALSFRTWALDNRDSYPMQVSVADGGTKELVDNGPAFVHFLVMSNELSTPKILICPMESDPNKTYATTFSQNISLPPSSFPQVPFTNDNHLSYFVGADANESSPDALLTGDRNLAVDGVPVRRGLQEVRTNSAVTWFLPRHDGGGNVALADGSVQQFSDRGFPKILAKTGTATNRLVLP